MSVAGSVVRFARLVFLCALGLSAGACATIVGGTTQEVLVQSEPSGAGCAIDRNGASIGVVASTPGKVILSRSKETAIVSCSKDGYEKSQEALVSSFTGATLGNILVGGLVGVAVDAASGANNKYPERVTVVLTPASFPDAAARDAHFAGIRNRIESGADAEIKTINERCGGTGRELCNIEIQQIRAARDKALSALEQRRQAAKIEAVAS